MKNEQEIGLLNWTIESGSETGIWTNELDYLELK